VLNLPLGSLYAFSVLLKPLESLLGLSRRPHLRLEPPFEDHPAVLGLIHVRGSAPSPRRSSSDAWCWVDGAEICMARLLLLNQLYPLIFEPSGSVWGVRSRPRSDFCPGRSQLSTGQPVRAPGL